MLTNKTQLVSIFLSRGMLQFYVKLFLILFVGFQLIEMAGTRVSKIDVTRAKLYLKGVITNPESLIISYEYCVKQGHYEAAEVDLKLAISLMEIHGANQNKINKYIEILNKLQTKKVAAE